MSIEMIILKKLKIKSIVIFVQKTVTNRTLNYNNWSTYVKIKFIPNICITKNFNSQLSVFGCWLIIDDNRWWLFNFVL